MRRLLSGNDFCGRPEAMGCHAHRGVRLILSTHNTLRSPCQPVRGHIYQPTCSRVCCVQDFTCSPLEYCTMSMILGMFLNPLW